MTSSIRARSWAVVAISAAIGAALRWAAVGLIGDRPGLLLCNVLGCGVIGYAVGQSSGPWLTAGLCGALTSCSAIALQVAVDFDGAVARDVYGAQLVLLSFLPQVLQI